MAISHRQPRGQTETTKHSFSLWWKTSRLQVRYLTELQYRSKGSWQSLMSRKTQLETPFSILQNLENRVSSWVSLLPSWVLSFESSKIMSLMVDWSLEKWIRQPKHIHLCLCTCVEKAGEISRANSSVGKICTLKSAVPFPKGSVTKRLLFAINSNMLPWLNS